MNQFGEKEILGDALAAQKSATTLFNTFSNECVHENLRNTMLDILADEHALQQDVFCSMHDKGFYPTPAADKQKISEAKQKFSCSYKGL